VEVVAPEDATQLRDYGKWLATQTNAQRFLFSLIRHHSTKINPELVARDKQGKPYTVRYEAVNAMLLNEFLKEHRKVEELEATVAKLQSAFKAQAAQIQKVSDQLQADRATQQLVANN
jgi:hypothetical protein